MVTARHHILTNEYRLNVSTNKTGDCLVRGYTMCGRSYTAKEGEMAPLRFESDGFWQEKPSVHSSCLSFLWLVSHPNIFEDVRLPTGEQNKKKKKKTQRNGDVLGAQREALFLSVSLTVPKMFVFCCFSFSRFLSPCALIKSRGQLKQQTVGGFVAACFSMNPGDKWCGSIFTVHAAPKYTWSEICTPLRGLLWHNRAPKRGLGCGKACSFDVSFSLKVEKETYSTTPHKSTHTHSSIYSSHALQLRAASKTQRGEDAS